MVTLYKPTRQGKQFMDSLQEAKYRGKLDTAYINPAWAVENNVPLSSVDTGQGHAFFVQTIEVMLRTDIPAYYLETYEDHRYGG